MDDDENEREQQQRDEDTANLIREESSIEKKISPVGFIPMDSTQEKIAKLLTTANYDRILTGNKEIQDDLAAAKEARDLADKQKLAYKEILQFLKDNRPCRFFIPNVGQEKAFLPMKTIDPLEANVHIGVFGAANMVGKTTMMTAAESVGCIWGKRELSDFFSDWNIFDFFENVRKNERRPLRFRIIGHAGSMEDGGQVFEEITKWWPKGLYKWEKNHKSYYAVCKCWDMDGNLLAVGHVRTHDQPRNAHAGHTLDFTLADEPMPSNLWAENVARLRAHQGGLLWLHATPLDESAWIKDRLAEDRNIHFTQACIWDNCRDYHPDPKQWSGGEVGKGSVLTRGHLARKVIETSIREWEKEGPEVVEARMNGAFTHLAGAVFKEFDPGFHVIDPFPIPAHWPIYHGVDPHDAKPHFAAWFAQSPEGRVYWVAEYPPERWDLTKGGVAIPDACKEFRTIENKFRHQVVARVGDPLKMRQPVASRTMTSQLNEFASEGFDFELGDNNVQVGASRIRELLMRDKYSKEPGAAPWFAIMRCNPWTGHENRTGVSFLSNLSYKSGYASMHSDVDLGSMIQPKWKDPFDVARYVLLRMRNFEPVDSFKAKLRKAMKRTPRIDRSARPWMR